LTCSAGWPFTIKFDLPGIQGAVILGIHGIGVRAPQAAEVADATIGFAKERHKPNGIIFIIGILSNILAWGLLLKNTVLSGNTISVAGVVP
jgi:hypothetical protein